MRRFDVKMVHGNVVTKRDYFIAASIAVVTLIIFSPLLWCDFVNFDDYALVTENPDVLAGLTIAGIRWAFTTGYVANWIPLSWISHMLDVQLFGLNPAAHHGVNILYHAANSMLVFVFFRRATGAPWHSAVVAFLFALHPLHVESVAWVAERKDVLSTFFWLLTMYAYLCYVEKPAVGRYMAVLGLFTLGLLSKPMLVTLPIILLLLDWWPLGRFSANDHNPRRATILRLCGEKIPLLLLSLCSSVITYLVQDATGTISQGYTLMSRAGKACIACLTYLYMMIWPMDLAVIYPFSRYPPSQASMVSAFLLLLLISALTIFFRKRYPFLITGWGWYLISLLPVIGLIQVGQHSVADRYTYISLTGIFVVIAWGVPRIAERMQLPVKLLAVLSAVLIIVLITLTEKQIGYWKNSFTLFNHAVNVTRGNWVAHNNLGIAYRSAGQLDEAINQFKLSITAKPSYSLAYLNLGIVYRMRSQFEMSFDSFTWAIMFEPVNQEARLGLGLVSLELGKTDVALAEYQRLLSVNSLYASSLLAEINKRSGK